MVWIVGAAAIAAFALTVTLAADECGERVVVAREYVHHGVPSNLGEWPWHVAVFHQLNRAAPSYACGGTLVSNAYVLTAAHCTYPRNKVRPLRITELFVRAGIASLGKLEPSLQQIAVRDVIRHEEFNTGTLENDIALLKLVGEVARTDYVKPVCFWAGGDGEELVVGRNGYIAGWGRDERNEISDALRTAVMPIVSRKACKESDPNYYTRYLYDRKTLCAGFRNGTSAGPGDSGGGLFVEINGKWVVRGIVSNGKADLFTIIDTKNYVVFTDVAYYRTWIDLKLDGKDAADILESPGENFGVCGKKTKPKSTRRGYREERPWPWKGEVFKVGDSDVALCEVAIIDENFLVGPADAFSEALVQNPSQLEVAFYTLEKGKNARFHVQRIGRIVRHERFDPITRWNNVALIELKVPLRFAENLRPICVQFDEPTGLFTSFFVGHLGDLGIAVVNGDKPCGQKLNNSENIFCYELSTQFRGGVSDLLYRDYNDLWYLRGITFNVTKFPTPEFDKGYYMAMLNMTQYKDWIAEHAITSSKIIFGLQSCPGPHAWMSSIHYRGREKCLAALVSSTLALTIADCINGIDLRDLSIFIDSDVSSNIRAIHIHPGYDTQLLTNNIAIVQLSQPVPINPICLPKTNEKLSQLNFQTMFQGGVEPVHYTGVFLEHEFEPVNLTLSNVRYCARDWARESTEVNTKGGHMCGHMMLDPERQPPCENNYAGLPLFYRNAQDGATYLRGLLDIPKHNHCDGRAAPEVYLDVMYYAEWIAGVAAGNDGDGTGIEIERRDWRVIEDSEAVKPTRNRHVLRLDKTTPRS